MSLNLFEHGKVKLKRECIECGFKHVKGSNVGVFVPREYRGGRYDEPLTPRGATEDLDDEAIAAMALDDGPKTSPEPAAEESKSGGMFGGALSAPKTATQKMMEARAAAQAAKKAAEDKAAGRGQQEGEDPVAKLHRKMTAQEKAISRKARLDLGRKAEKLNTPSFVRAIGYVRCNCFMGVPHDEPREYVAVPEIRFAGEIEMKAQYVKEKQWVSKIPPSAEVLRLVETYCDARTLAKAAMVCKVWLAASNEQPHYLDLKYMEAVANFEAHDGKIEDLFCFRRRVYTAGTKCVKVWGVSLDFNGVQQYDDKGMEMYGLLHTPVRDTAIIGKICRANQSMYSAASNGAIREWTLAHNIQNIKFSGAMWEHSAWVNCVVPSLPTPGTCSMHGVLNHICLLYTSSDDRSILVWDSITRKRIAKVDPPNKNCGTMRQMSLSDRHIFIGSSNGIIYVYPYERTCEREDRHECHLDAGPKRFCLQTQLRHGTKAITALNVTGPDHTLQKLFSGSQDGTIAVFQLAAEGFQFETIHIFDVHKRAITGICSSWSHIYSASDDGFVAVWNIRTFDIQRTLNCGARVKCIYVDEAEVLPEAQTVEDAPPPCGYLYCGLTNGYVQKWRIGTWM